MGSRRDYLPFAIIETAFVFTDHRFLCLPPVGKLVYLMLWCRAFVERRATLPLPASLPAAISRDTGADRRTVTKMLQKCYDAGLLRLELDGRITVIGVHGKGNVAWKDQEKKPQDLAQDLTQDSSEVLPELEGEIEGEGDWITPFIRKYPEGAWGTKTGGCFDEDGSLSAIGQHIYDSFQKLGRTAADALRHWAKQRLAGDGIFPTEKLRRYADELRRAALDAEADRRRADEKRKREQG